MLSGLPALERRRPGITQFLRRDHDAKNTPLIEEMRSTKC